MVLEKIRRNKKGSIEDLTFLMIFLLVVGLTLLITFKVSSLWNDEVQASSEFDTYAKEASSELTGKFTNTLDGIYLFGFIMLFIVAIVSASLVRIHPIFIPVFLVIWVIIIFIGGAFSSVWNSIAGNSNFITAANQLTFVSYFMNNLAYVIAVVGMVLMIVMYKAWRENS